MNWSEIAKGLAAPFSLTELEVRALRSGINRSGIWVSVHFYVTNRSIQNRFDSVVGPENWKERYVPVEFNGKGGSGFICEISVRDPASGEWVAKQDGASLTDIEPIKGGLSDSEKRCAAKWGVGRYLYELPEAYGTVHDRGEYTANLPKDKYKKEVDAGRLASLRFRYNAPVLPARFLPGDQSEVVGDTSLTEFAGSVDEDEAPDLKAQADLALKEVARARDLYSIALDVAGVEALERLAFAEQTPSVPSLEADWKLEHYEFAQRQLTARGREVFTAALTYQESGAVVE